MKGTRPLDNNEIRLVSVCFDGTFEVRNRGLFMLGVSTGGRISELLSLTIGDVYQNESAVTDLLYDKSIVKGGEISRAVPVNKDGRDAIDELITWHRERYQNTQASRPLFPSRHKSGTVPMHRQTAHQMLKKAFIAAGLNGKIATHSLRKSFAQRVYEQSGDIYLVKELLGHRNVATTQQYLGVNYADAREAVESISLDSESYRRMKTYNSLKKTDDETLISELVHRGYEITSTARETPNKTANVVKIG
ncbi:recombinase XerD [Candidatus Poribacteria bacterium]|nr:MAG: recombinase XerD [Candidatus Poribacteria bacterium]